MIRTVAFVAASLTAFVDAAQPGAPAPVAAPMRDLDWGQINFLHTTDTHGWLGGHLQEAQYSADWGDYVSFTQHMRKKADDKGVDLIVIDTGDRIEGNGLYDGSEPKGKYTYDIFNQQTIDILCTGNHELYHKDSVAREHNITVPHFKKQYIASNLDYIEPNTGDQIPQAQRYIKFKTKNQGYNVVALGFLFDFDRNANNSVVQHVEDTVKEEWFKTAISEKPDLFVVIGHVGLRMKEFELIFKVIRDTNWYTPIAFFGGHMHVRDARKFDDKAFAIASGRYFETIGWMSIDGVEKKGKEDFSAAASSIHFNRRYIDNNLLGLQYHTGLNETEFPTAHGRNVSQMIVKARKELALDHTIGCSPRDFWMSRAEYPSNTSIFTWLEKKVIPDVVVNEERKETPRLTIVNTGAVRFDLFKGPFTTDSTFLISPFTSRFNYIPDVSYKVAKKVLQLLNSGGQVLKPNLDVKTPESIEADLHPLHNELADALAHARPHHYLATDASQQKPLVDGNDNDSGDDDGDDEPELTSGYTTKDDLGDDGDDAVHSPIKFYAVPNCIQSRDAFPSDGAEPETVDLVFVDYVQPYLLTALKFSGGDYNNDDVKVYLDQTLTDVIASWVGENWKGEC
ncbi:Metallo-dependent phosphatase-like protein [Xylariaceae sp. FL0255]|nr:Metallo-dependent phosphatase-like protein [Xylariaceae sp. FL0255]